MKFVSLMFFTLLICYATCLQFSLEAKSKKCFKEDIPLNTDALFSYTVAQGDGDMPVSIRISDVEGKVILSRSSVDHGIFSFRSLDRIPGVKEKDNWALHDDDKDEDDEAYFRALPDGAGDNRVPYIFCFDNRPSLHLPRLSLRAQVPRRKILFSVRAGAESKTAEYYDDLAKEKHLSSTEELFRVVEDRVSDVVRLVDEMRQRELRLDHINHQTERVVTWYSILTCVLIGVGALFSSHFTFKHLSREKII